MKSPRYRVKTLILATTIAAVVLACLAPWLRELSPAGWKMLAFRAGLLALGAVWFVIVAQMRYHYHLFSNRFRPSSEAIVSRCRSVHADPIFGIGLVVLMLPGLAMMDSLFPVWRFTNSPGTSASSDGLFRGLVVMEYLMTGVIVGFVGTRSLTSHARVLLTADRFVSRAFITRWKPGMRFRWQDRVTGRMLLILPKIGQYELSIDEDQIEAAEQLLTKNLPTWH